MCSPSTLCFQLTGSTSSNLPDFDPPPDPAGGGGRTGVSEPLVVGNLFRILCKLLQTVTLRLFNPFYVCHGVIVCLFFDQKISSLRQPQKFPPTSKSPGIRSWFFSPPSGGIFPLKNHHCISFQIRNFPPTNIFAYCLASFLSFPLFLLHLQTL